VDEELETALNDLPEAFRAVVLLADMEGLSYDEVAATIGVPVGTVRSRLFRGRTQLRAALDGYARRRGLLEDSR
jgi:RNA polymerase sigma-70 factor (ECF subfamily)